MCEDGGGGGESGVSVAESLPVWPVKVLKAGARPCWSISIWGAIEPFHCLLKAMDPLSTEMQSCTSFCI